jgi:hypothetical protein
MAKSAAVPKKRERSKDANDASSKSRERAPSATTQPSVQSLAKERARSERAERKLGQVVAFALPLGGLLLAIGVALTYSVGTGILVLAGTAMLGTIGFLWASLRTLSGDAPLAEDFAALAAMRRAIDPLDEKKKTVLRALKDLEHERAIGKIDEDDYLEISANYREQAKELMREMDAELGPQRERAERIAQAHLRKRGFSVPVTDQPQTESSEPAAADAEAEPPPSSEPQSPDEKPVIGRVMCAECETSNEVDAAFCKKCGASLTAKSDEKKERAEDSDAPAQ